MPFKAPEAALLDIYDAVRAIQQFTAGMDFTSLVKIPRPSRLWNANSLSSVRQRFDSAMRQTTIVLDFLGEISAELGTGYAINTTELTLKPSGARSRKICRRWVYLPSEQHAS